MQHFAHVTDDVIDIGPVVLPQQWRSADEILYTGLKLWTLDELLAKDWRPVVDVPPVFDPITQELGLPVYTVAPAEITGVWPVLALSTAQVEINQDDQASSVITRNLNSRHEFAITTLMEMVQQIYVKLRAIDSDWDLTAETKRKAQRLSDAVEGL